jgi:hypothetical protein
LAAGVAAMVVGFLWYGPLFGKAWLKLSGHKMGGTGNMNSLYAIQYVASVVSAYVLAVFLGLTGATTLEAALPIAVWLWLGFQATLKLGVVLWEGKSWNLFFLEAGHSLVTLLVMAAVLVYVK